MKALKFRGIVKSVSRTSKGAVVALEATSGKKYAVVGSSTRVSGSGDELKQGQLVEGEGHEGPEAIIADVVTITAK